MMKCKLLLAVFLIYSGASFAQNLDSRITAVYGNVASQLDAAQIAWLDNCLNRSEIIPTGAVPVAETEMALLSSLPLQDKYTEVSSSETFNSATFNPLIYSIDYFKKTDQYFRIDNTNFVLKIHKKED